MNILTSSNVHYQSPFCENLSKVTTTKVLLRTLKNRNLLLIINNVRLNVDLSVKIVIAKLPKGHIWSNDRCDRRKWEDIPKTETCLITEDWGPFLETPDNFPGPVTSFSSSFICQLIIHYWRKLSDMFHENIKIKF